MIQLILFSAITVVFITAIIVSHLMTKTEKTQKWGNYFDNCKITDYKYKYYLQIHFRQLPKQIRDFHVKKQPNLILPGSLYIVITDNMKRMLGTMSLNSHFLCKYICESPEERKGFVVNVMLFKRLAMNDINRFRIEHNFADLKTRINISKIVLNDLRAALSYTALINSDINRQSPKPVHNPATPHEFKITTVNKDTILWITPSLALKPTEYMCFAYLTIGSVFAFSSIVMIECKDLEPLVTDPYIPYKIALIGFVSGVYTTVIVFFSIAFFRFYINEELAKQMSVEFWTHFKSLFLVFIGMSSLICGLGTAFFVDKMGIHSVWWKTIGLAVVDTTALFILFSLVLRKFKFFDEK